MLDQDDLLRKARERAEAAQTPHDWGELLDTDENAGLLLRCRGETTDEFRFDGKGQPRRIFLFWNEHGDPVWASPWARLVAEWDRLQPQIGDDIALWRGPDYVTRDGNTGYAIALVKSPNPTPLPSVPTDAATDLPF